jgi:restriction endonuclease S subunit
MAKCEQHQLGDCLTLMSGGTPSKARNDYWGGDIPWVSCKDMKTERIHGAQDHLTPLGAKNGTRLVPADTILFVVRGMILAREFPVAMTKRTVAFNQDLKAAKPASFIDNEFLFQWLRANTYEILGRVDEAGHGTTRIQTDRLLSLPISVPPLPIQRRIASILSAYDELIENNQRRIKILESMARALYREWFVHFRFPGYESVPRVASPLGEIPQGWEAVPFERLLASMTGGDWGSEQPEDRETEAVIVVRGTDFDEVAYGGQLRAPVRYIKSSSLTSRGLKVGDVIIENSINAKSRSVGTTLLVEEQVLNRLGQDAIAASFCKVFRPHDQRVAPLIHLHARHLREISRMEYYQNVAANGIANFQAQKFSKEEHLVLPVDEGERTRLVEPIGSIFRNVAVLASRLANLRRTRDLLLPRLLSGQINVEESQK